MKLLALHFSQMDESNWLNCPPPQHDDPLARKEAQNLSMVPSEPNAPVDRLESPTADSSALK